MTPSFYGKIRSENYDNGTDVQEIVDFYLGQWHRLGRPNPVLEPMCGTGLNLILFLEAGASIEGLDSSPHMLSLCRQKLKALGLDTPLYEQSLEKMALPQRYGFMFIPDRSFAHIYDKAQAQIGLGRLYDHLLPDGWLIFDVKTPSQLGSFGQPGEAQFSVEDHPDGSTIFSTGVWGDVEEGRVVRHWNKYELYVDGKLVETEIFDYRERLFERAELEAMLIKAGFQDIIVTKPYENSEPVENGGLVFICHKGN